MRRKVKLLPLALIFFIGWHTYRPAYAARQMSGADAARSLYAQEAPEGALAEYVNNAIQAGIVPEKLQKDYAAHITRAEFCALAVAVYERYVGEEITALAMPFEDTDDPDVLKMAGVGAVNGSNGRFDPHGIFNRQQAAVLLIQLLDAMGFDIPRMDSDFSDRDEIANWAKNHVGALQNLGLVSGTGVNSYVPLKKFTRAEAMTLMWNMWGWLPDKPVEPEPEPEPAQPTAEWAEGYVMPLGEHVRAEWINPYGRIHLQRGTISYIKKAERNGKVWYEFGGWGHGISTYEEGLFALLYNVDADGISEEGSLKYTNRNDIPIGVVFAFTELGAVGVLSADADKVISDLDFDEGEKYSVGLPVLGPAQVINEITSGERLHYDIIIDEIDENTWYTIGRDRSILDFLYNSASEWRAVRGTSGGAIMQNGRFVGINSARIEDTVALGIFASDLLDIHDETMDKAWEALEDAPNKQEILDFLETAHITLSMPPVAKNLYLAGKEAALFPRTHGVFLR